MYKRKLKKEKRSSNLESEDVLKNPPTKRRLSAVSNEVTSDQGICCFCKCIDKQENLVEGGTLYATKSTTQIDNVKNMTANWIEMAKVLQDENLLIQISHGDVASNEMYYHKSSVKCCYQKYRKRYIKKLSEKDKDDENTSVERWFKITSLNKVIHHIKETENETPGRIFEVRQLENKYIEILKSYGYFIESHVSGFGDMLKEKLPGIELRNVSKKLTLYFKSTADALINESVNYSNDFYQTLLETALPLYMPIEKRRIVMKKIY